jgi:hypothetical protein
LRKLITGTVVVLGLVGATAVPAGASASGTCSIGNGVKIPSAYAIPPHTTYGYTKVTSIKVSGGISCSTGEYVVQVHGRSSAWSCTTTLIDRTKAAADKRSTCVMKAPGPKPEVQWTYHQRH